MLLLLLHLQPALGDLVPGSEVSFVTRAGYKYVGEPEVGSSYSRFLQF